MPAKKTDTPGGNAADLAAHPLLWGQALPLWTENGMEFAYGSHWTEDTYDRLIMWMGECKDQMRRWMYGPEVHRKILTDRMRISKACAEARAASESYDDFAKRCDGILPSISLTSQESESIESVVNQAERSRKYLWDLSGASKPRPQNYDQLTDWTTARQDLLLRLGQVGLVPRPPEMILPKTMPKRLPSRQARLESKPSADPKTEDVFA